MGEIIDLGVIFSGIGRNILPSIQEFPIFLGIEQIHKEGESRKVLWIHTGIGKAIAMELSGIFQLEFDESIDHQACQNHTDGIVDSNHIFQFETLLSGLHPTI
jgi:hypothetical protein